MAKMKVAFIDGMVEHSGVKREFAETFWSQLEAFADYCFNKSHSACYGLISYQTAYLKAHYPSAFMAALMTSDFGNIDRIAIEVAEAQRMGIKVLPPDVNESFGEFAVVPETGNIRFGLSAVKNVGGGAIEAILSTREADGSFASIEDFAKRVNARDCNKKAYESLAKAGAFDSLIACRGQLLHNLELIVSYAQKSQKNALSGQIDIFGSLGTEEALPALRLDLPPEELTAREQLGWERELLGLYLSHHPLDDYAAYLGDKTQPLNAITPEHHGKLAQVGGMITQARRLVTKKGDQMAFATIEDRSGSTIELIVFPKAYEKTVNLWDVDKVISVSGKISARDRNDRPSDELQIMVDGAREIDYDEARAYKPMPGSRPPGFQTAPEPAWKKRAAVTAAPVKTVPVKPHVVSDEEAASNKRLVIKLPDLKDQTILLQVRDLLSKAKGHNEVYLVIGADEKKIKLPFLVSLGEGLTSGLEAIVGPGHVALR